MLVEQSYQVTKISELGDFMAVNIAIDGSNLALRKGSEPSIRALLAAIDVLRELVGEDGVVRTWVDASLVHQNLSSADKTLLNEAISSGRIKQTNAGTNADPYILKWADDNGALVISNDMFREFEGQYSWLTESRAARVFGHEFDEHNWTWTFMEKRAKGSRTRSLEECVRELHELQRIHEPVLGGGISGSNASSPVKRERERITRKKPHSFVVMIDQSNSMNGEWESGVAKKERVAEIVNSVIAELILRCTKATGVRNYFRLAVIGYPGSGSDPVQSLLPKTSLVQPFAWISEVNESASIEMVTTSTGGQRPKPRWITATSNGQTPMSAAFKYVYEALATEVAQNKDSYPPVVINITDGVSTDGKPAASANRIETLSTLHGSAVVFNAHVGSEVERRNFPPISYPTRDPGDENSAAQQLFDASSVVPSDMRDVALNLGLRIEDGARGMLFNSSAVEVVSMLNVGTEPGGLA